MTIELTQNELRALVAERAMNIHVMALSASTIRHTAEEIKDQVNRLNVLAAGLVGV